MSESTFIHVTKTGKLSHVPTVSQALAAAKKGGFLWLNYYQPTKDELAPLIDLFGLHPLSIEDCLDTNQVSKIDDLPRNTFVLFNAFSYVDKKLSIDEVDLFIGDSFLITVSGQDAEGRRPLNGIERTVELDVDGARQGPAFLLHVILDHIVDQKFAAIEALELPPAVTYPR